MRFAISVMAGLCLAGNAYAQDGGFGVFEGSVTDGAPSAEFPVELTAGSVITLSTDSIENFDTILTLIGPDGKPLAENDDRAPGNLQSLIVQRVETSGRYVVAVTGYGGGTGEFELTVREGVEVGLSNSAQILSEDIVMLDRSATTLTRSVDLSEGDIFVASTFALTEEMDTVLSLSGADGTILAENDDRGDGSLNSQLVFLAEAAGRYSVEVGSYSGSDTGDLVLSLAIDPDAEVPFDFAGVEGETIGEHSGTIDDANPSDDYPVELRAGQTIYAVLDTIGGDLDPVLRLRGPDGHAVALNDDRGDGSLNSALAFTATESGAYTVNVERYRAATSSGQYALILRLVDAETVSLLQEMRDNIVRLSGDVLSFDTEDFRVFYTLEGRDASTEEYALSVGEALQEVYDAQVNRIGWAEPIRDEEGLYRAFISDADGSMGVTYPVQIVFDNPNTRDKRENTAARTVFLIENDFRGLGKEAPVHALMRATATHEFNHVVQFGYDAEEALDWLYESTASWTETTTVGADQDATDYVSTDYEAPQICWTTSEGGFDYAQWTLLQSIADQYGEGMIVEFWENSVDMDGFETMASSLERAGTTLPDAVLRWRAQNFARDYELAPLFDATVAVAHTMSEPGSWSSKGGLEETGANYIMLDMSGQYDVSLDAADGVQLILLGHAGDQVQVIPLGSGGSIDTTGFDTSALMVFNANLPAAPGDCTSGGYGLEISPAAGRMPAPAYSFSAAHFERPE
ncbi:PPC domain-containing protein [Maricaulis parjimensis]|uniref:PPC domain-containing protein n=1 Tax=Maricaulis parjimensis TaxID=144023 RepID=UPI00193AC351|nr:PPC domain-containing protein [Maricaulis parjimensis]